MLLNIKDALDNKVEKWIIVDGMNLFIRSYSANPVVNQNGEHMGGLYGSLIGLGGAIDVFKPDRCIVVFDGKDGSKRRKEIYPAYKAHRNNHKGFRFNRPDHLRDSGDDEAEEKNFTLQLFKFIEVLDLLPVTTIIQNYIEADDVISIITNLYKDKNINMTIVSADKDFFQLINDKVKVYNPTKKLVFNECKVLEDYNVHPQNFSLYKSIMGDNSDNIKGVPGMGEKTIVKYFGDLLKESTVKTFDDLTRHVEEKYNGKKKIKCLEEFKKSYNLLDINHKLIELNDLSYFNNNTQLNIKKIIDEHSDGKFIKFKILIMMTQLGLMSAFRNIDDYLLKYGQLFFKNKQ